MDKISVSVNCEDLQRLLQPSVEALILSSVKGVLAELKSDTSAKKYFTRRELCDQLGISLPTLDGLVRSGKVKSYKIGSRILFKVDEVDSFLQTQRFI